MRGYLFYFLLLNWCMIVSHTTSKAAHRAASIAAPTSPHGMGRPPTTGRISIFSPNDEWMYSDPIRIANAGNATLRDIDAATMPPRNSGQPSRPVTPPSALTSFVEQAFTTENTENNPIDAVDIRSHDSDITTPKSIHHPRINHAQQIPYPSNLDFYPHPIIQTEQLAEQLERPRRRTLLQRFGCMGITASIGISMANLILLTILIHMQQTHRI